MAEPTPIDPEHPDALVAPPTETELRGLRKIVKDRLGGVVHRDRHFGRKTRIRQNPDKRFSYVNVPLTGCDHEGVVCDIPIEDSPKAAPMRICLVCDGGRELLGLNGKPI